MDNTIKITKDLLNKLELNPHIEGLNINIEFLENILSQAIHAYYNTDKPLLSDNTFDILENIVRINKPNSYIFDTKLNGSSVDVNVDNNTDAVKLPYYMSSLNKVKPNEKTLSKWIEKHNTNIVISEKLDGLSALLIISSNTNLNLQMQLYKHGDGYDGQNISNLLDNISITNNANKKLNINLIHKMLNEPLNDPLNKLLNTDKHIAVRGEIIIKNSIYNTKYSKMYPKARSLVAGIVNSKHPDIHIVKDMEIIFYEFIYPDNMTFLQQFEMLKTLGFNTAKYKLYKSLLETQLPNILLDFKKDSAYEIDGIVLDDSNKVFKRVVKGNPEYAVAFKMQLDEQIATTTIVNVEYNISKHGTLAPRIEYKPIVIKGDTHQYTTGFNLKYIIDNNIGIGTEIKIIKSGDVIPYIYEIIKPRANTPTIKTEMPNSNIKWHWNPTHVDAIVDDIDSNQDVHAKKLISFFKVMKIDGVGEGVIHKFINAGCSELKTILELTPDIIASLEGFQIKSATNIYNSIHKVIDIKQPLERIMNASGVFDIGMGDKKFKTLLDAIPNFLQKWEQGVITKNIITNINGFSDKTTDLIFKCMDKFITWLALHNMCKHYQENDIQTQTTNTTTHHASIGSSIIGSAIIGSASETGNSISIITDNTDKTNKTNKTKTSNKLTGMIAVFTGIRNSELEEKIISNGGIIGSSITGKTTIIIAKNPNDNSSKLNKARETGIEIINITDFEKKYIK